MLTLAVDLALACLVAESLWLFARFMRGRAPSLGQALATLGAGFFILLAFRMALADLPVAAVLSALALAGLCHIGDARRLLMARGTQP